MADALIPAVIPARRPARETSGLSRRPLPLPGVPTAAGTGNVIYGMSRLDASGRIADHTLTATLGWRPDDQLVLTPDDRVLTVQRAPTGTASLTGRGHLLLPAPIRHRLALHPADRVLLAADPAANRLILYPLATVHAALATLTRGGAPA